MADETLVFESEEAKITALDDIADTPENVEQIRKVMDAPIRPKTTEGESHNEEPKPPTETPDDDKPDIPKDDGKSTGGTKPEFIQIPLSELPEEYRNFDNAGKILKKIKNQDETIERQTKYIRDNLQNRQDNDELEKVRQENEQLRREIQEGRRQGGTAGAQKQAERSESKINSLKAQRQSLYQKFSDPEDRQFNTDFLKEKDRIEEALFDEMETLHGALLQTRSDIENTKRTAESAVLASQQASQRSKEEEVFEGQVKSIQSFVDGHDEFKLSKPFMEVDKEYSEYQNQVATVYWGRPPQNRAEKQEAMDQLQRKSPALLNNLKAAGYSTEPTADMERYLAACEVWDSWQGIRKDPITGDYRRNKDGTVAPLVRWDPISKTYVPDTYPNPEAAYNDLRVKNGFYTQKIVDAYKQGGKSVSEARSRRDNGVVEMDNSTGGKVKTSVQEAETEIEKIDEMAAVMSAREGNPAMLTRYNEYARILGWPEIAI